MAVEEAREAFEAWRTRAFRAGDPGIEPLEVRNRNLVSSDAGREVVDSCC